MSTYATIAGEIMYPDLERYEAAKAILRDGDWIDEEGAWLDENGNQIEGEEKNFHENALSITIPAWCHRNLLHVLPKLTNGSSLATGHWASTDGQFCGGHLIGGDVELHAWAEANGLGGDEGYSSYPTDEKDWDDYSEWQCRVVDAFMEN